MKHRDRPINWKHLGIAALFILPVAWGVNNPAQAAATDAAAETAKAAQPTLISGTVQQYFTNRAGYVTALNLETSSGVQQVRFAPSWGKRLLKSNAVGTTLDGWVVAHQKDGKSWNNLVSIGKKRPHRFLSDEFHSGAQKLDDGSWIWKNSTEQKVNGKLSKIVINDKGDILALILDNGALIRVPRTVRNVELGANGSEAIAPLFKNVQVSAWGPREWQASGNVSIYNQHLATTGLAINGRPVSAIGIPRFPVNRETITNWNVDPIGSSAVEVVGLNGEYAPFDPSMAMAQLPYEFSGSPSGAHIGHAMLQTTSGKFYPAVHEGMRVFAVIGEKALLMPLVNGKYIAPVNMRDSKLVMVMDDGRQFEMSSSNGYLYVILPDGNTSQVEL